ncbi:DnaJ-domain-containing protein [Aspergillus ellipticus CBS 707.79]|uniref:DnaJ-domain-containing protein n=1 Tax=Aspergillus ellipticus CBS 707.79 TaxID=1448320 RepID=A0A319CZ42_9EURO|nr:DnaJ-domain-containing protein [Aspergillus ellipticus CBS 707.79]
MFSSTQVTNYYSILGISHNSTLKDINSAYKKLALKHHPDKQGSGGAGISGEEVSHDEFQKIQQAVEILRDATLKQKHDDALRRAGLRFFNAKCEEGDEDPNYKPMGKTTFGTLYNMRCRTDRYMYSYGNSVHMDPFSPQSMEAKARAEAEILIGERFRREADAAAAAAERGEVNTDDGAGACPGSAFASDSFASGERPTSYEDILEFLRTESCVKEKKRRDAMRANVERDEEKLQRGEEDEEGDDFSRGYGFGNYWRSERAVAAEFHDDDDDDDYEDDHDGESFVYGDVQEEYTEEYVEGDGEENVQEEVEGHYRAGDAEGEEAELQGDDELEVEDEEEEEEAQADEEEQHMGTHKDDDEDEDESRGGSTSFEPTNGADASHYHADEEEEERNYYDDEDHYDRNDIDYGYSWAYADSEKPVNDNASTAQSTEYVTANDSIVDSQEEDTGVGLGQDKSEPPRSSSTGGASAIPDFSDVKSLLDLPPGDKSDLLSTKSGYGGIKINDNYFTPFIPHFAAKISHASGRYTHQDLLAELRGLVLEIYCGWLESVRLRLPSAKPLAKGQDPEKCLHLGYWDRRTGQDECKVCHLWNPLYAITCPGCGIEACVGCRFR